jgi:hypothetical protein
MNANMKREELNSIIENYRSLRAKYGFIDLRAICNKLIEKFCSNIWSNTENNEKSQISESMIYSLIGYEFQREMRLIIPKVNWISIINQWMSYDIKERKSLLLMAKELRISAAIVAQHVLQYHNNYDKNKTKKCFSNTSHINNGRLAFEVMICNLNDIIYGNHSNHITNNSGLVFESEVKQQLRNSNISFMTETDLRSNSFDVTPDFRLNLPLILIIRKDNKSIINLIKLNQFLSEDFTHIGRENEDSEYERVVITWIECKSLFASVDCHSEYYCNQFSSYINRFGNGLVLYKHGFVSDIPLKFNQNIVINDKFPIIN